MEPPAAPEPPVPAPLCLVRGEGAALALQPAALAELRGVAQPVVVVAVAGRYRTGKSFLMNRLAQQRTGFPLGSTVQAQTKGIWVWCRPHPRRPGVTLVLLDTEGLADPKKDDDESDAQIFTLALLLCSTLVYNSMGTIDQDALQQLRLVAELSQRVRARARGPNSAEELIRVFPSFVWVVRDFTLQLRAGERPLTDDEYLEDVLRPTPGSGQKAQDRNELRRCLREFFPQRKLFTLGRPAGEEQLAQLEQLREEQLQPRFLQQAAAFCQHIWERAPEKQLEGGHRVTGRELAALAEQYVAAMAAGAVPCVESAVAAVARAENTAAVEAAVAEYRRGTERDLALPTASLEELAAAHECWERRATELFLARAFHDSERRFQAQLVERLQAAKEELSRRNEAASEQRSRAVLRELWGELEPRLQSGEYAAPGGAQLFQQHLEQLLRRYRERPGNGVRAEAVLEQFLGEKQALVQVLQVSGARLELAREQQAAAEAQAAAAKAAAEAEERELRRSLEEQRRQLELRLREEQRARAEELERIMEHHRKELDTLRAAGCGPEVAAMRRRLQQLEEEAAAARSGSGLSAGLEALGSALGSLLVLSVRGLCRLFRLA